MVGTSSPALAKTLCNIAGLMPEPIDACIAIAAVDSRHPNYRSNIPTIQPLIRARHMGERSQIRSEWSRVIVTFR